MGRGRVLRRSGLSGHVDAGVFTAVLEGRLPGGVTTRRAEMARASGFRAHIQRA